jgi:hypothetical protein
MTGLAPRAARTGRAGGHTSERLGRTSSYQVTQARPLVCDQEDPYFRLYMIRGGEMRQLAPAPPPDDAGQLPW